MKLSEVIAFITTKWQQIRRLPFLVAGIAVAAAAALLIVTFLWARTPPYRILFSNLSADDGGAIVSQLEQLHIPYQLQANGSAIQIPSDQVDRIRLTLASHGLPKGGSVGFELMDNQPFGISQFTEHVNYERALEGELSRSIETINAVDKARVHLAIPQPSLFVREKRLPSAAIMVSLRAGRVLDGAQVAAITHLVASSVTNMPINQISIVDQQGNLLTHTESNDSLFSDAQFKFTSRLENSLQKRIEGLLTSLVGAHNVRVVVNADIDFAKIEQTQEQYDPNSTPDKTAIRSKQSSTNLQKGALGIGGVPGALSNQPPVTFPTNNAQANQANQANTQGTNTAANAPSQVGDESPLQQQQAETVNYELNRIIRYSQQPQGVIKRLSVAVAVNYADAPDGKNIPLDAQTLDHIKLLTQEAMGFSEQRGDSIQVVNMPFDKGILENTTLRWWQWIDWSQWVSPLLRYLLIALVAWFAWRKLLNPAWQRILSAQQEAFNKSLAQDDKAVDQTEAAKVNNQRHDYEVQLKSVRERARKDPYMIALIIKSWLSENG